MKEKKIEIPLMSEEDFIKYLQANRPKEKAYGKKRQQS